VTLVSYDDPGIKLGHSLDRPPLPAWPAPVPEQFGEIFPLPRPSLVLHPLPEVLILEYWKFKLVEQVPILDAIMFEFSITALA
jgi:hypothetical protein